MTDNGACYRSTPFRDVLAAAGVVHKQTRPYRPQTNGKVERLNLTLKWEWAYAATYRSSQARLDTLQDWVHRYNHHRPHMAHGGGAPMSVFNNVPGNYTWGPSSSYPQGIDARREVTRQSGIVNSCVCGLE